MGDVTSTFTNDDENRAQWAPAAISDGATVSFVYDADGNRVKSTIGGVTTVYIAGVFEFIENGATDKITKYYEGNAMRRSGYGIDDGVFYLLQDQLNSSSGFVDQAGNTVATNYYYPYGANRGGAAFSGLSTKRFTGQYHESSLPGGQGLSYYNARWYDAQLGRFLSADTIVPGPANPQAFNRYSYVLNNPLSYVDPTGHAPEDWCSGNRFCQSIFFLIYSGNMDDQDGLQANWTALRDDVWYYEKRPDNLGSWGKDKVFPEVDHVTITRSDYINDIKSRPSFSNAMVDLNMKLRREFGNRLPPDGYFASSFQKFTLAESAMAERYNAVEWFLGSHTYDFTVVSVNSDKRTALVRFAIRNYSGWESATRWPGGFNKVLGTSIYNNKGGQITTGSWMHYTLPILDISNAQRWYQYGATFSQSFVGTTTIHLPYFEPVHGPR